MLPTIIEFIQKYKLEDFVVVADSGLMNNANMTELETLGYKYIIGAKIKNERAEVGQWILQQPKVNCRMVEYKRDDGRRLLVGYLTNTDMPVEQVYDAYHNLWNVESAFRIAKSKIKTRPMFHFTRKRIEAHVCICFIALKVYKELSQILKSSDIKLSVDKMLALAKTITTIQIKLPLNKTVYTKAMLMPRQMRIAKLFDENLWGTQ